MNDEQVRRRPSPGAGQQGQRFRRHELKLADGGTLTLRTDGSIVQADPLGAPSQTWLPGDPAWASQAIRFGLHPQAQTVVPQGRNVRGTMMPRQ